MPHIIDLKKKTAPSEPEEKPFPSKKEEAPLTLPKQIEWTAPEFEKYQKEPFWYIIGAIVVLLILVGAILLKNIFFALIIILAGLAIYIYSKKEPRQVKFKLSGQGIQVGNVLYPYANLRSFWIFYDPPELKYLSVESEKLLLPYIKIPLADQDPVILRNFLIQYIPEKHQEESLIDIIARRLRF